MEQVELSEFENLVAVASGLEPNSDDVQLAVWEEFRQVGRLYRESAATVADRAREKAGKLVYAPREEKNDDAQARRREWGPNAESALISNAFAKRLEPWACGLRERCFGLPGPPFREWEEAVGWIKSEVKRDREKWKQSPASKVEAEAEIRRLADLAGLEVKVEPRGLRYYEPDNEYTQLAPAFPGTTIEELARETNRVSEETAFHPVVLTAFVLCGATPAISRIRITETSKTCRVPGDRIPSRWVNIRFNAADVKDTELRALYKDVRESFGANGSQRITWPEFDFLSLVDEMGGPPGRGRTRFWEEVLGRWKAKYAAQSSPLGSWKAARNKYHRLNDRGNIRTLMKPNPEPSLSDRKEQLARAKELAVRHDPNARR